MKRGGEVEADLSGKALASAEESVDNVVEEEEEEEEEGKEEEEEEEEEDESSPESVEEVYCSDCVDRVEETIIGSVP